MFNPDARVREVPLMKGVPPCLVIDDALVDPEGVVRLAAGLAFRPPAGFPYPGLVAEVPYSLTSWMSDLFARHARGLLGGRRTLDASVRASLVTTSPAELEPRQWQCHRDRVSDNPQHTLFAASVLYLFKDPEMGGTSFYRPRLSSEDTDQLLADSQLLDASVFASRYGLAASYMIESNAYFERVVSVPAAWNRLIFYDGGVFHSADISKPERLSSDPHCGRLTLNGFFTCRRPAI
jgi:hypothetical protein